MPLFNKDIMMTITRTLIILIFSLVTTGCAQNHISGGLNGDWAGKASLIGGDGNILKGSTIFNVSYKDGTFEFPVSPWGALEGKFSFQDQSVSATSAGVGAVFTGNQTIAVPTINSISLRRGSNSGKAYLATDGKVVLLCNITGGFVTTGNLDWEMIGTGICADSSGKTHTVMFERSTSK